MRIVGINIPENKHLEIAICSVYGIGKTTARKILHKCGVDYSSKVSSLTEAQEIQIRKSVESFKIEGDLRRSISKNIKRLKDIKSVKGYRHSVSLPVNGQRTKTNARTRKGPRKTMGSGRVSLQKK